MILYLLQKALHYLTWHTFCGCPSALDILFHQYINLCTVDTWNNVHVCICHVLSTWFLNPCVVKALYNKNTMHSNSVMARVLLGLSGKQPTMLSFLPWIDLKGKHWVSKMCFIFKVEQWNTCTEPTNQGQVQPSWRGRETQKIVYEVKCLFSKKVSNLTSLQHISV